MSNRSEIQRILQQNFPKLEDNIIKTGWINKIIFGDTYIDTHKIAIKMGSSLETIFHQIAKLRYPGETVPRSFAGWGVTENESDNYYNVKYEKGCVVNKNNAIPILTKLNPSDLSGFVATELETFFRKRNSCKSVRLDLEYLTKISNNALQKVPIVDNIIEYPVDLCLKEDQITLMELKSTFDTDDGKTKDELYKMIKAYIAVGNVDKRLYFGVISNNRGYKRNGEWCGRLGSYVSRDLILIEETLWDKLSPIDVSFNDFIEMFDVQYKLSLSKNNKIRTHKKGQKGK